MGKKTVPWRRKAPTSRGGCYSSLILSSIVFVHGLGGHPQETWQTKKEEDPQDESQDAPKDKKKRSFIKSVFGKKNPAAEKSGNELVFWPRDLLPSEIPKARILTYGYNADTYSGVFQPGNKNSILQHGDDLSVKLERSLRNTKGPIIFLGHSLGGLVIKAVCYCEIGHCWNISMVLLLGVPRC
jgi:hypothetical protein